MVGRIDCGVMKIIAAGYSKTGTKSLAAALTQLGYKVYDYLETIQFHCEEWMQVYQGNGSTVDFKTMYENVDVIVDCPGYVFWKELHNVFPNAKVNFILNQKRLTYGRFNSRKGKVFTTEQAGVCQLKV